MKQATDIYAALSDMGSAETRITDVVIGLVWIYVEVTRGNETGIGLAMRPQNYSRTLEWSGCVTDIPVTEILSWFDSWDVHQVAVAMATANAIIDLDATLVKQAEPLVPAKQANLTVFDYFARRLVGKKVVVVGRYPGIERVESTMNLLVIERQPDGKSLPDSAAEFLLPEADWVFLTASSLVNKTFPRLLELAKFSNLVLMGPTTPWLSQLADLQVDFLAGIRINDRGLLKKIVSQGGGTRIFDQAVSYCVLDLQMQTMNALKREIADLYQHRANIKTEMDSWYQGPWRGTFPKLFELETIDKNLSLLDSRYKKLWDARNASSSSGAAEKVA